MHPLEIAENSKNVEDLRKARSSKDILSVIARIRTSVMQDKKSIDGMLTSVSKLTPRPIKLTSVGHAHSNSSRKLSKYKPLVGHIEKHFLRLRNLAVSRLEVEAAEATILKEFSGARNKAEMLTQVIDLQGNVYRTTLTALKSLHILSKRYVPKTLGVMSAEVEKHLKKTLDPKQYGSMNTKTFVSSVDGNVNKLSFQSYISIQGLINSDRFIVDNYYIVVTCLLDNDGAGTFHVTTLPEFKNPGEFDTGKEVDSRAGAIRLVNKLLSDSSVPSKLDIGLDNQDVSAIVSKDINSTSVIDGSLLLELRKNITPSAINEILTDVLPILSVLIGARKLHTNHLMHKLHTNEKTGQRSIEFILVPDKAPSVDVADIKLHELSNILNLPASQVQQVREALAL